VCVCVCVLVCVRMFVGVHGMVGQLTDSCDEHAN
jgi:hypothetical protein